MWARKNSHFGAISAPLTMFSKRFSGLNGILNITYKIIWLSIVAYPLWSLNQLEGSGAEGLTRSNFIGFIIKLGNRLSVPYQGKRPNSSL